MSSGLFSAFISCLGPESWDQCSNPIVIRRAVTHRRITLLQGHISTSEVATTVKRGLL
jgi:hypothetical protein